MNNIFWNDKFLQSPNLYGEHPNEFVKSNIASIVPGKILFPGEGEGRNALYASSLGWRVTAIDQSEIGKKHCLQKADKLGLKIDYYVCDALVYMLEPESFDVVALVYFHLPEEILAEVYSKFEKALKVAGTLIIEGFGKNQLQYQSGGPKNLDMLYELSSLKSIFKNLKWEIEFDGIIQLNEGIGHVGEAHVIRLVGKKIKL
ncbi:class I SAM-dependent methyltransferase [Aquiflexum gelatinilyticum]|uniref:Class I SAM-dependent methyltransferase n=1 Tax=Aquiflexum gelatinilyticum TaxID=2961943 RepID=A0A9X2P862_9BACT|nr:class I SAM-dependent methyltransferase [Aquiflexum gelatinilyticum]MCR9013960.1 class I SAM-dependent methyltransferase [Aquiflexum gelatinilyticum]